MLKTGQPNLKYPVEIKLEAVRLYEEGSLSYQTVAERMGIRNCSQVKQWVKKYRDGSGFEDGRGKSKGLIRGRPKTQFASVEEELIYVKAERDYLKKRYPNLHPEVSQKKRGLK